MTEQTKKPSRFWWWWGGGTGLVVIAVVLTVIYAPPEQRSLTTEQHEAIRALHGARGWEQPTKLELRSDRTIVVDYEQARFEAPRPYGEARMLAIREILLPFGFTEYRVNVNGPSPGTGLVRRYGSARFIAGRADWVTP